MTEPDDAPQYDRVHDATVTIQFTVSVAVN